MDIGDVLSEAWALYRRFFWQFFLTALIVFGVLDLLSALAASAAGDGVGAGVFWGLIALVIGVVGYFWVQGALSSRSSGTFATVARTARSARRTRPFGRACPR